MPRQVSIPINLIRAFNYANQHIAPGSEADNVTQVVDSVIGLHSARLPTPFVTLLSRVSDFRPKDLIEDVYVSRKMVKLRCMRRTLHIVNLEMAPVVHQATLRQRLSEFSIVHKLVDLDCRNTIRERIVDLVSRTPLSSDGIVNEFIRAKWISAAHDRTRIIKAVLKELWEDGTLCYINASQDWSGEKRKYGCTSHLYPTLVLSSIPEQDAQKQLIEHYIRKFGPVTEGDISWWTGLGKKRVREIVNSLGNRLVSLRVSSFHDTYYIFESSFDVLRNVVWSDEPWV
ncbi:MAG: winged helix DNA-binding domain-containing protein, partial [Candidatus Kapabacteria bacterium]|nr:winged helix DNA-binding domain-containing protein [Candidatus Kapabacteria bacterium]